MFNSQSEYHEAQSGSSPSTMRYTTWWVSPASCSSAAIRVVASSMPTCTADPLRVTGYRLWANRLQGEAMTYFVTGGTGFIGRNLIQRLLDNREGQIHVLVREGSTDRLQELIESWGQGERIVPLVGDITEERLGVSDEKAQELKGKVDHFFHLAAMYDMTADSDTNLELNVGGTRNAIDFANAIEAGTSHPASSIGAAGMHKGLFREDMFDEGQKLEHP